MSAVEEVKAVLPTLRYPFSLHGDCVPCELAFRHAERLDALEGENERLRAELAECARWRADLADKLHAAEAEIAATQRQVSLRDQGIEVLRDALETCGEENTSLRAELAKARNDALEEAAMFIEQFDEPRELLPRPSIDELEKMLNSDDTPRIQLRPDGSLWTGPSELMQTMAGAIRALKREGEELSSRVSNRPTAVAEPSAVLGSVQTESPPTQVPTSASSGDSIETGATPAPGGGFVVLVGQLRAMSRFVHADHSLGDKAADAIEEVVRKWGEEIERRKQTQAELAGETERAEAAERERDALRQDAERYRWLRSVIVHNGDYLPERFWELLGDELDEDFDAAIDRARRG